MNTDEYFGKIIFTIEDIATKSGLSKNELSFKAYIQRQQIIKYYKDEITRIDTSVLARLCYALNCDVSDILKYIPPEKENKEP